jgi:hypothetical protein
MRVFFITAAAAGFGMAVSASANAACERHIYNNSAQYWRFTPVPDSASTGPNLGNVWFYGSVCNGQRNGECKIPAHTSVTIKYTTTLGTAQGQWRISDDHGVPYTFNYHGESSECPYIAHSGNTGSVSVNDKANGDMSVWKDYWHY